MKSFYDMMSDPEFLNEIRLSVDITDKGIRSGKAGDRQIDPQKELIGQIETMLGIKATASGKEEMTGGNLQKMYELAEALLQHTHWYLPIPVVGKAPLPDGSITDHQDITFTEVDREAATQMKKSGVPIDPEKMKKTSLKKWMEDNNRPDGVFLHKVRLIKLFPNGKIDGPDGKSPAFIGFESPKGRALALPAGSGSPGQQIDEVVNGLPGGQDPRTKKWSKTIAFRDSPPESGEELGARASAAAHSDHYGEEYGSEFDVRDYVMQLYYDFIYSRRAAEGGGKLNVSSEPFEIVLSRDKFPHLNVSQIRSGTDARKNVRNVLDDNPAIESFESWVSHINE
jgi:hypothetical protein